MDHLKHHRHDFRSFFGTKIRQTRCKCSKLILNGNRFPIDETQIVFKKRFDCRCQL